MQDLDDAKVIEVLAKVLTKKGIPKVKHNSYISKVLQITTSAGYKKLNGATMWEVQQLIKVVQSVGMDMIEFFRIYYEDNKEIQDYYNMTVFPKFVWVCEISSKALYENQQVLGEIIIDATSSPDAKMDSIIIVNYPYALCRRMPEDFLKASEACFEEVKEWKPYDIFRGNLTDCQSL